MVMRTLPETYVTQLGSILAQDLRSSVAAIRCPTLILVGAQDASTPPSTGEQLAKAITGAKFQIIDDANHLSNIDQPEAFNAAVRAFAAEVPGPSGP
jgi:pimeloyl-ACP methyl ester carboxylesterase